MARLKGSRNADYEQARERLLQAVQAHVVRPGGAQASFRELAEAAGVSVATLRHYFSSREALLQEVMGYLHQQGLPYLHAVATGPLGPVEESLRWFLRYVVEGWRMGVGAIHAFGLTAGVDHPDLGPAYVQELLEPTLQAAEARLARHVAEGELRRCNVRHAALALVCPVVLGLLHQVQLTGSRCRPLEVEAFLEDHLQAFLRAWRPEPS